MACRERKKKPPERHRPPTKPLPDYRNEAGEFGPNAHCEGLEPFEALEPDEFLAGPEGLPLSSAGSRHLRRVGLDFREGKEAESRKLWLPHERERWQRSKRLRSLMKRGLVSFFTSKRDAWMMVSPSFSGFSDPQGQAGNTVSLLLSYWHWELLTLLNPDVEASMRIGGISRGLPEGAI